MKSIKVTNTGRPEVLKLEKINLDKPGADEVQIEHVSIGLNYIDTYHRSGLYPLQLPTGIGMEAASASPKLHPPCLHKIRSIKDKPFYCRFKSVSFYCCRSVSKTPLCNNF